MDYSIRLLWAEDGFSQPIGVVAFAFGPVEQYVWIELAYTSPEHRRKGVYRALFLRLVEMATRRGVPYIAS
jgi:GNAT superfamily N-acetyltransferase